MSLKIFLFTLVLPFLASATMAKTDWEKIYEAPELTVYRKEVPGYDTFAFKAVGIIKSPLAKVATVLIDADRRKEWMPDVGDTYIIQVINPEERVEYVHLKTPFVIKDREFVLHAKSSWNRAEKSVTFSFDSTSNSSIPDTKRIRAELFESRYVLKDLGDSTEVEFTVHVDPKGTVPKWLVNLFQKNYPRKTIEALAKQSQKSDIVESPAVLRDIASLTSEE